MSNTADFTQGSILKKLCRFMLPVLGALILQAAYGAVDLLVVGRFGSTSGLSAVSTGSQVLNLVTFVVTQLAMGVTVLIARYIGEKREKEIGAVLGGAAVVFTILAGCLFVLLVLFARPISVLMQAPQEALALTTSYVRICGCGILFIVAYNVLSAVFRGLGDSRSPLLFVLVACLVNVVGDLLLVAGLHLDAAGAALATVLAQAVSVVCALAILRRKKLPFTFRKSDVRLNEQCRRFLAIGLPLALQEFLTQLSFLALCAFVNRLGLAASSGYGVASKIVSFVMLVPSALMQSMASFVAQNIGASNVKRAKKSMFTGIAVGVAFGIVMFALVLLKGDVLAGLFSTDAEVVRRGFEYLRLRARDHRDRRSVQHGRLFQRQQSDAVGHDTGSHPDAARPASPCILHEYPAECKSDEDRHVGAGRNRGRHCAEHRVLSLSEPEECSKTRRGINGFYRPAGLCPLKKS